MASISNFELMERAGSAVSREIERRWSKRVVSVLCGPGNNGGDGFATAHLLAQAGWVVQVSLLGPKESIQGASLEHAKSWQGEVTPLSVASLDKADLVVDAIFGTGLNRKLFGPTQETMAAASKRKLPIVAIDVPSGLMTDTGEILGAVAVDLTVTYFTKKPGHVLQPGRSFCGEVVVTDLGLASVDFGKYSPSIFENDPRLWIAELPYLQPTGNKYTKGHALISGGYPTTGAARLAARGAARAGAGLVTIAVPTIALPIYATALLSIMIQSVEDPNDFLKQLEDDRYTGILIGPGSGISNETRTRVLAILKTGIPTIIDADALSIFQNEPSRLFSAISGPCILTPHEGEFQRLFETSGDKLKRARAAAFSSGAVVVLKGSDTVIASPDGRAIINTNAPPTLATGGAGDVLSGIVLGLITQGMDPFFAAAAGVWMHGSAATRFGQGLIAEDLPDLLPTILQHLNDRKTFL